MTHATVTRYIVAVPTGSPETPYRLFGPQQGRNTFATAEEAHDRIFLMHSNNSTATLQEFRLDEAVVCHCECWENHHDPLGIWFGPEDIVKDLRETCFDCCAPIPSDEERTIDERTFCAACGDRRAPFTGVE